MAKRIKDEEMRFSIVVNGNEAQKELYKLEKSTRDLQQSNKNLRLEKARLEGQNKKGTAEYKRLTKEISNNNKQIKANQAQMKSLQNQIGLTGLTMRQLRARARELRLQLDNMVSGSAQYKKLEADLKAVNARIKEVNITSRQAESNLSKLAGGFNKYAALTTGFIAASTGVVLSMQKMIDYNGKLSDAQANVRRTTGLTADEVDELTKSFGALNTRTSRIELLKLAETAGRLGFTAQSDLKQFAENMNMIKVALEGDLDEAQILEVGKMTEQYKIAEKESTNYHDALQKLGSAINEVSKAGNNQAKYAVDFMKRTVGVANSANLAAADMIGYAAAMDEAGQSVEISGTMMNKVIMDLFQNTETYANIAGIELSEFNEILNNDTNKAFKLFIKGLKGNNEGFKVMLNRLEDLNVGGTRGEGALIALANGLETIEARQKTANDALKEGTSLVQEYNIKNNNLAANLEKISRRLKGLFISDGVTNTLNSIVTGIGKLIGAIEDADRAMMREANQTYKNIKAHKILADESANLLIEYEYLTKDGIVPTQKEKEKLEMITLSLKDNLGDSVVTINEETGAYELNTEAVKNQIKAKRLLANQEASNLASQLVGVKQRIETLQKEQHKAQQDVNTRKRMFEETSGDAMVEILNNPMIQEPNAQIKRLPGAKQLEEARTHLYNTDKTLKKLLEERDELIKELDERYFSEEDIEKFFEIPTPKTKTKTNTGDENAEKLKATAHDLFADLLREQRKLKDDQLSLEEESFQKELNLLEEQHRRKMQDIRAQMHEEAEIREMDAKIRQSAGDSQLVAELEQEKAQMLAINAILDEQLLTEEQIFQHKKGALVVKGHQDALKELEEQFKREQAEREVAQFEELMLLAKTEEQKQKLREQFEKENARAHQKHLQEMIELTAEMLQQGQFEGINLEILTDEQKNQIKDRLAELGLSLREINAILAQIRSGGQEGFGLSDEALGLDIFGFTVKDWIDTFDNLDTVKEKLGAAAMAVQGMMNVYQMYAQFRDAADRRSMEKFERDTNRKKESQKNLLDNNMISQRQYDKAIEALEKDREKKRAEMEYKAAMREWQYTLGSSVSATAAAVAKALPNIPLSVLVGSIGLTQTALVGAQKPVKGFEDGLYPVQREQDGKMFNAAFGGYSRTGMVDRPTVFLAGEQGKHRPEMIISGEDYAKFDPAFRDVLHRQVARAKGYEEGYYPARNESDSSNNEYQQILIDAINRNSLLLEKLDETGITAYLVRNMENAKQLREDIKNYEEFRNRNKL